MPPSSNGGPPSGDGVGPLGWHGSAAGVESIRTRDGTRLSIWTWGSGHPALVHVPGMPWTSLWMTFDIIEMAGVDRYPTSPSI